MKRYTIAVVVEIDAEDEDDALAKGMTVGDAAYFANPSTNLTTLEVWVKPVSRLESSILGVRHEGLTE